MNNSPTDRSSFARMASDDSRKRTRITRTRAIACSKAVAFDEAPLPSAPHARIEPAISKVFSCRGRLPRKKQGKNDYAHPGAQSGTPSPTNARQHLHPRERWEAPRRLGQPAPRRRKPPPLRGRPGRRLRCQRPPLLPLRQVGPPARQAA